MITIKQADPIKFSKVRKDKINTSFLLRLFTPNLPFMELVNETEDLLN